MVKQDLLNRYGPTMTVHDLAEVLHVHKNTIHNRLHKKTFEIDMFKLGGKLYAETGDVAEYIENAKLIRK